MGNSNVRVLPHVCGNKECREFILPPFENLSELKDGKVELCKKCKDKQ